MEPPAATGGLPVTASGGGSAGGQPTASGGLNSGGVGPGSGGQPGLGGALAEATGGAAYDPSIDFDWPETKPPAGACTAGRYVGRFSCELTFIPGFPPSIVEGPVTFTLEKSENGEFLEIKNGRLEATAYDSYPFSCDLEGKLDCSTRTFQAKAENGTYGTAPFLGVFFGDMSGTLDGLTSTLAGDWALSPGTETMPLNLPCNGPWSAVLAP